MGLSRRAFLAASATYARAAIVQTDFSKLPAYGNGTLAAGIRSRHIAGVNGMNVHILESGYETPNRPAVLLLHGFPELTYSWRKIMPPLAAAGYHVIAPDQRGYGRTTGWDDSYDANPDPFRILNMTRDAVSLIYALGHRNVAMIVGHDAGAPVAAWSALIRPDVFHSVTIMSSPFEGPPALSFNTANGALPPPTTITDDELDAHLAKLSPPRKYYQNYQRTRGANEDMPHAPQGLHAFFRGYYYAKSADYAGNNPHPLKARTAAEMAQIPAYYVMEKDKGMAATAASFMPSADYIARCRWLTESDIEVYATEYARTGFTGALQGYRVRRGSDPKSLAEMRTFSGRSIEVPSQIRRRQKRLGRLSDTRCGRQDAGHCLHSHGRLPPGQRCGARGTAGAAGAGYGSSAHLPARSEYVSSENEVVSPAKSATDIRPNTAVYTDETLSAVDNTPVWGASLRRIVDSLLRVS